MAKSCAILDWLFWVDGLNIGVMMKKTMILISKKIIKMMVLELMAIKNI
mgnify:CR=1 FL=1